MMNSPAENAEMHEGIESKVGFSMDEEGGGSWWWYVVEGGLGEFIADDFEERRKMGDESEVQMVYIFRSRPLDHD